MDQTEKQIKKAVKKERRQREARIKTWMETSRTICSLGAFCLSVLSVAHVYGVI